MEANGLEALGGGSEVRLSTQRSAVGLARAARGILCQVDARVIDHLPSIHVPTLIIVGDGDTPFLNGCAYMASHIPNATHVVVPHAGHGANVDQPDIVNNALRAFLDTLA